MPEPTLRRRIPRASARVAAALAAASCLLGASLALAPAAHAAPPEVGDVTVTSTSSVDVGDAVDVVVAVDDVADLYAYSLTISFDPALLDYTADSAVLPAGGFDSVTEGEGSVTVTHTRLGTSPGLDGAQQLVALSFTGVAAGDATITAASATFVSSTGETAGLVETTESVTEIIAAASPTPSASPTPTTTTPPVVGDTAGASSGDPLASTGQDAVVWVVVGAFAAAAVAAGAVLVARRRAVHQ